MFSSGFGGFNFGFGGGSRGSYDNDQFDQEDSQNNQEQKSVDTQELYNIIGIDKKADINEIRKQFKKSCIKGDYRHPDKGGDPEKFKKLNEAYEILTNPEKRDVYDKYGLEGLKEGGGSQANNPFDLLSNLFGGGGSRAQAQRKAKTKEHTVELTLDDVYKGKYLKTSFKRLRTCEKCEGKGGVNAKTCIKCKGQKIVIKMVRLGPNTYSQTQQYCDECEGKGTTMKEEDQCKTCKGQKIVENLKELEVPVEPGVPHEYSYKFVGEADEAPGIQAGDLYVKIVIKKHKLFERVGADLYINKSITLLEALSGFFIEIEHLDGSKLKIASPPGYYITNGQIRTIKGKGMPFFKDAFSYGNLYIRFKVEFPKTKEFKPDMVNQLKQVLTGNKKQENIEKGKKLEYMQNYQVSDLNPNPKGGKNQEQDDSENDRHDRRGHTQNLQCAQQ